MERITGLDFWAKNSAVTLGKFDGIHCGHRFLLSRIIGRREYVPTVFTFQMRPEKPKIYTQAEKDAVFEELGVAREIIFPFNETTRQMSPQQFIEEILAKRLDVKYICVGEDFRFGKDRAGDVRLLLEYQKKYGYQLEVVQKLVYQREEISSTRIRSLLEIGNLETANRLLGEPYFMTGDVLHGNALGKKLDMPTANLALPAEKKLLPLGVYATTVLLDGKLQYAVTNIGKKPTIGEYDTGVETHIIDYDGDLYGKTLTLQFHSYLRPERKFASVELLRRQLAKDREQAYQCLEKNWTQVQKY